MLRFNLKFYQILCIITFGEMLARKILPHPHDSNENSMVFTGNSKSSNVPGKKVRFLKPIIFSIKIGKFSYKNWQIFL